MQNTKYMRLTTGEREKVRRSLAVGMTQREIARLIGRHPSTIFREIKRNRGLNGYRGYSVNRRALAAASSRRRGNSRLAKDQALRSYVVGQLSQEWSPQEIGERLKKEYPLTMNMRISHEAIYRYIYVLPRGEQEGCRLGSRGLRQSPAFHAGGAEENADLRPGQRNE